jgi:hypothetical protein
MEVRIILLRTYEGSDRRLHIDGLTPMSEIGMLNVGDNVEVEVDSSTGAIRSKTAKNSFQKVCFSADSLATPCHRFENIRALV